MAFGSQLNAQFGSTPSLAILGELTTGATAAGTTQAAATAITTANTIFTTVAAGAGGRLPVTPTVSANDRLHVANHGANTLALYPPIGGRFGTSTVNAPALMAPGKCADFFCVDGLNYTALISA